MVKYKILVVYVLSAFFILNSCKENKEEYPLITRNDHGKPRPNCKKPPHTRESLQFPETMVDDWGEPIKLSDTINTFCPEDAIEISPDGTKLYFMYTEDLLEDLGGKMLSFPNGTYVATRSGGPGDFSSPTFFELGLGMDLSLDGELSFSPDGSKAYFHSNRSSNIGYKSGLDDFLDIYVATITNGVPGIARNVGAPVNSVYADGEAALHPDGVTLYFASARPGPTGYPGGPYKGNIWRSIKNGSNWGTPEFLPGSKINWPHTEQKQPTFTSDGNTMYFVSDRFIGAAIYRSTIDGEGNFSDPELVIKGIVGEPSLTSDGQFLYFIHVLYDAQGGFDTDIWYVEKN